MPEISGPATAFILAQPEDAQLEILQAVRAIEANPYSAGEYLPFPWDSSILGSTTTRYFITYRMNDGTPEFLGVVKTPTPDDIRQALEHRLRL